VFIIPKNKRCPHSAEDYKDMRYDYFRYLDTRDVCCTECFMTHVREDKDLAKRCIGAPHGSVGCAMYLKHFGVE
jgi:hypothetical protein